MDAVTLSKVVDKLVQSRANYWKALGDTSRSQALHEFKLARNTRVSRVEIPVRLRSVYTRISDVYR